MACNKSKQDEILFRRQLVGRLRVRQMTVREIAKALDAQGMRNPETGKPYDHTQIHRDIRALEAEWRDTAAAAIETHKAQRLAEYAEVKREAWKKDDLPIVLNTIKGEREMLGLDAPQKVAPTNPDGDREYGGDLLDRKLDRLAIALRAEGDPGGDDPG